MPITRFRLDLIGLTTSHTVYSYLVPAARLVCRLLMHSGGSYAYY